MSSVLIGTRAHDSNPSIRYTPCSRDEQTDDDLQEISIGDDDTCRSGAHSLSNCSRTEEEYDAHVYSNHGEECDVISEKTTEINGPKQLPGYSTPSSPNDKTKLIGERLSSGSSLPSPINSSKIIEQKAAAYRARTTSRQSIFELVRVKTRKPSRDDQFNVTKRVKSNETVTSKEVRKIRRKEIETRFGKKSIRTDKFETLTNVPERDSCNWTFVFDPSGRLSYWWSSIVSIAFIYNFWVIIYRFAFQEISNENISVWFPLDYLADTLYVLDIAFHFRTGYLEDGVLQTDSVKLRIHYMNTTKFYIDCLCLLPLDFLYLSIGFCSILRCFRLVKVYRFWTFLDRTERHTNYPNVMRTLTLMHYLLALFHWNACLYYLVACKIDSTSNTWEFPKDNGDVTRQYLHALYWSTLTLTTVGNLPRPRTNGDYMFILFELMFGLLLFATVLGHISNIVSCISAARKDFQAKLDGVKTYMSLRRVPLRLQDRVIKWFDYLWMCNKSTDEEKTLSLLPDKLKAEIAIHVHLDTLQRVEIFQQTEAGFLCELVLRLNPVLFSPGDYICRKATTTGTETSRSPPIQSEVGKEMYIVNRGRLHVVGDNGKTVLAMLKPGSYFGEISILNMGTLGNRRTASVRSVGYSDLFRLSKKDLWDVLKEYPAARVKLETVAVKRLEKTKVRPIEEVSIKRSKSTPGMIESSGKIPMNAMSITRHHTLPAGLPTQIASISTDATPCAFISPAGIGHIPGTNIGGQGLTQCDNKQATDNTNIPRASSMTSFVIGTPTVRSPTNDGSAPMFHFTPPITPGVQQTQFYLAQNANVGGITNPAMFTDCLSRDPTLGNAQIAAAPVHLSYSPYTQPVQFPPLPQHQVAFLSPFCAAGGYIPPPSPNMAATRNSNTSPHLNPSQPSPVGSARGPSQQSMYSQPAAALQTGSPVQYYNEATHDSMVQEITRLRERLATLESENSALSTKLNQQQWELEHRLSELEMQMCPSETGSSAGVDDVRTNPFETISRESII